MQIIDSDLDLDHTPRIYREHRLEPGRIIDDFSRSGKHQVEVLFSVHEYRHAYSCRNTLATTIIRMNLPHIEVRTLNGHVYLVNTLIPRTPLTERSQNSYYRKRRSSNKKIDLKPNEMDSSRKRTSSGATELSSRLTEANGEELVRT